MPRSGAVDGEVYHGAVKIKFGPFPLVFEGTARVVRAEPAERRLVVKANARDRRGAAAGAATVTADLHRDRRRTAPRVQVASDLDLTGRPAQLGSGAISSVSDRLADQFVGCIGAKLAAGLTADGDRRRGDHRPGVRRDASRRPATGRDRVRPEYAYRPPSTSESAPHLQVLPDVARTWLPWAGGAVGGLAVLVLLVRWLRRR